MKPFQTLQLIRDGFQSENAKRTVRVLGNNAGSADSLSFFDHRPFDQSFKTLQWLFAATMLLAPAAVSEAATATVDMRDTALAIAARATSLQLKLVNKKAHGCS
jgi:hypothetical protein